MNIEHRSHFSNLISLAYADGKIVEDELKLLSSIGKILGLSDEEIHARISHPQDYEFVIPESASERYNQLYELITMIMIDGEVHAKEVILLKKYAHKLGFSEMIVDNVADKIREYLKKGFTANTISEELPNLISKF
ncbi:MAG: TerB family tellurite resistance protein [Bacteroidetes bacterium]|nr:TerB family tellurite resistance protein [Bacteroidota bacterium]